MGNGICEGFQLFIRGFEFRGASPKLQVQAADFVLAAPALRDVVFTFEDRDWVPVFIALQRPSACHQNIGRSSDHRLATKTSVPSDFFFSSSPSQRAVRSNSS